ncbi:MAG: hypothetical protein J6R01_07480 [Alistipes sp.]|nr:hypothetical protein [Alistipes sp.]MBO7306481.1 hypothetical protein [Alistipes sp.]
MNIRRFLMVSVAALFITASASAQLRTSYFMEGTYFRTELNPVLVPTRGYLALPGVSGVGVNLSSDFLSVEKLYRETNSGWQSIFSDKVTAQDAFANFADQTYLNANVSANILGIGWNTKGGNGFWSLGLNSRTTLFGDFEKGMFEGLKSGSKSGLNSTFDLTSYVEAYLGSSFKLGKNVSFGFRVKALFGAARIDGTITNATRAGQAGTLTSNVNVAGMMVKPDGKGANILYDLNDPVQILSSATNMGIAGDLGLEIRLLKNHIKLSAGITDLGFINWSSEHIKRGQMDVVFNMDQSSLEESYQFGSPSHPTFSDMKANQQSSGLAQKQTLNYSVNAGLELNFLRNHVALGVMSHTQFVANKPRYTELTASLNLRLTNWFSVTGSHTFENGNQPGVFGAAINFHPRVLNIFVGADFIDYNMATMANGAFASYRPTSHSVYAGVSFSFTRSKAVRIAEKEAKEARKAKRAAK